MRSSGLGPCTALRWIASLALLGALGFGGALPAQAANPAAHNRAKTAATAMAEQAGKAYESGDFQRAAQLYYNAWQTDDATPDYLFAAARAAHVGGLLDMAVAHYEEYLKTPGIDATRDKKAHGYLQDIHEAQAAAKGQEAEKAQRMGDANLAVQLYTQAWQIAPHRFEYRFKAAVVQQTAGQTAQAETLLVAYLADAPDDAPDRPEAEARLASIRKKPGVVAAKPTVVPPPVVAKPVVAPPPGVAPPPVVAKPVVVPPVAKPTVAATVPQTVTAPAAKGPSRVAGWILTVAGAALIAGGAAAAYVQYADGQTYAYPGRDSNGLITSMTAQQGAALADKIDRNRAIAGVCGGLGATALGLGIWQLVRTPSPDAIAVVPTLNGAALAGRF